MPRRAMSDTRVISRRGAGMDVVSGAPIAGLGWGGFEEGESAQYNETKVQR